MARQASLGILEGVNGPSLGSIACDQGGRERGMVIRQRYRVESGRIGLAGVPMTNASFHALIGFTC